MNQQRGPPKIAPKPRPAPKPKRNPQARVLYDYDAQDNDEISLKEGQIIEVKMIFKGTLASEFLYQNHKMLWNLLFF